jgi:hypothetical protein
MSGHDPTLEPRDSWLKTEASLDIVANAAGYLVMMLDVVIREIIPEIVADNLKQLRESRLVKRQG